MAEFVVLCLSFCSVGFLIRGGWGWVFGRIFRMGHASARLAFCCSLLSLLFKEIQLFAEHIWRLIVNLCTGPIEGIYALPHSWSLLETLCTTYRGVGRYWRFPQSIAIQIFLPLNKGRGGQREQKRLTPQKI
jgi:hypothetical protein